MIGFFSSNVTQKINFTGEVSIAAASLATVPAGKIWEICYIVGNGGTWSIRSATFQNLVTGTTSQLFPGQKLPAGANIGNGSVIIPLVVGYIEYSNTP